MSPGLQTVGCDAQLRCASHWVAHQPARQAYPLRDRGLIVAALMARCGRAV